jgi:hypothetical protein
MYIVARRLDRSPLPGRVPATVAAGSPSSWWTSIGDPPLDSLRIEEFEEGYYP